MHHPRWKPEPSSSRCQVGPRPQVGVVEHAADYEVFAELPSSRPEDVSVQIEGGSLIIRARRADPPVAAGQAAGWQVQLAFGDRLQGDARVVMQGSLLHVTLPKAPGAVRDGSSPCADDDPLVDRDGCDDGSDPARGGLPPG